MNWALITFLAVGACVLLGLELWTRRRLGRFWRRGCAGRQWRRRFPAAGNTQIRVFLQIFTDAFALPRRRALAFEPDDRVIDVYRAMYPLPGTPDSLELETLEQELERRYGVPPAQWPGDVTLAQLFERTTRGRPA